MFLLIFRKKNLINNWMFVVQHIHDPPKSTMLGAGRSLCSFPGTTSDLGDFQLARETQRISSCCSTHGLPILLI